MYRQCEICGCRYPERWMMTVFTGRMHWVCWDCYKKGQGEAAQVEIKRKREQRKEILKHKK